MCVCVYCHIFIYTYIYYVYINTHTLNYLYMLNIFIYNMNNTFRHVNACKYFQDIYCMCVYLYIHNKYTQNTHIYIYITFLVKLFFLDMINCLAALNIISYNIIFIYCGLCGIWTLFNLIIFL